MGKSPSKIHWDLIRVLFCTFEVWTEYFLSKIFSNDSNLKNSFKNNKDEKESPLLFYFDKALKSSKKSNECINTKSWYKLYTYYKDIKHYITVDGKNNLALWLEENKDIIKSKLLISF